MNRPDPSEAFAAKWLADRRADLLDVLSLCESPIERLLLTAILAVTDEQRSVFHIEAPPWPERRIATSRKGSLYVQYDQLPYWLDLAIVGEQRIAVEIDGHDAHSSKEQRTRDATRDRRLTAGGWTVLRFPGHEVYADAGRCAAEVLALAGFDMRAQTPLAIVAAQVRPEITKAFAACASTAEEDALLASAASKAKARLASR